MHKHKRSNWRAVLAACGMALIAAPAAASDFITDPIDLSTPGDEAFGGIVDDGPFVLVFDFVAPATYATGLAIEISSTAFGGDGAIGDIDFDGLTMLDGVAFTTTNDPGPNFDQSLSRIDLATLGAGPHRLVVSGSSVGFGLFSGNFLFPADVPEPSTWAQLIAGLFALGASLRARRAQRAPSRPGPGTAWGK